MEMDHRIWDKHKQGGFIMNDRHFVITIERQYGSGGRLTGKRLAEELGIHFYDEEKQRGRERALPARRV